MAALDSGLGLESDSGRMGAAGNAESGLRWGRDGPGAARAAVLILGCLKGKNGGHAAG